MSAMTDAVRAHYDALIEEGNDPVLDPPVLRSYMDGWDGEAFLSAVAPTDADTLLEIGVGTGRLALRVAPLCRHLTGIDLSPKSLERAREHLAEQRNVTLLCGDFLTYPFDERYDVIYSSLTFMHIGEKARALEKAASLLRVGGRLVLSIDKDQREELCFGERRMRLYPDTREAIRRDICAAGLTVCEELEAAFAHITVAKKQE